MLLKNVHFTAYNIGTTCMYANIVCNSCKICDYVNYDL